MSLSCFFRMEDAEKIGVKFTPVYQEQFLGCSCGATFEECECEYFPVNYGEILVGYKATLPRGIGEGWCIGKGLFQCRNMNQALKQFFARYVPCEFS